MQKIIIIIGILILSNSLLSKERIRIAVMPFDAGNGVSKSEAKYLTEKVRISLIETEKYDVITNDQIQIMLKTKAMKQKFGNGSCTSQKCIIDLGNMLECEKMIIGQVGGEFEEFSISVKLLDVAQQKYETAKQLTLNDKKELPKAAIKIIKLLFRNKGKPSKYAYLKNRKGISSKYAYLKNRKGRSPKYSPKKKKPKKTIKFTESRSDYHSPAIAGISSLLPFWSGSWNTDFSGLGLLLVGGKIFPIATYISSKDDSNWNGKDAMGLLYFGVVFVDIIYSVFSSIIHNEKYGLSGNLASSKFQYRFSFRLNHQNYYGNNNGKYFDTKPDGMNIFAFYYF